MESDCCIYAEENDFGVSSFLRASADRPSESMDLGLKIASTNGE